jgi:hypothetical protein
MWCETCAQDVPAVASAKEETVRCARCGEPAAVPPGMGLHAQVDDAGIDLAARAPAGETRPPEFDDWELDEEIRRTGSVLKKPVSPEGKSNFHIALKHRFDPPQFGELDLGPVDSTAPRIRKTATDSRSKRRSSPIAWAALSLGLMAFVCGAVLLGWSLVAGRSDLWSLGLPITLAGQCTMILGLVFQMERVWQAGAAASDKLEDVDSRLDDLDFAASQGARQHDARAFYSHMADGASPKLLLADLRGQLDLLSLRMGRDR